MSITKAAGSLRISRMGRAQCLTTEVNISSLVHALGRR
jgi:hypothetical protein